MHTQALHAQVMQRPTRQDVAPGFPGLQNMARQVQSNAPHFAIAPGMMPHQPFAKADHAANVRSQQAGYGLQAQPPVPPSRAEVEEEAKAKAELEAEAAELEAAVLEAPPPPPPPPPPALDPRIKTLAPDEGGDSLQYLQ